MEYKLNQLEARVQGNSLNTESDCLQYNHLNFEADAQEQQFQDQQTKKLLKKQVILSLLSKTGIDRN